MSKTILVVGGNSGIGAAIAAQQKAAGNTVVEVARSSGGPDLSEPESVFPAYDGALHGLVYCPGSINLKPFSGLKLADFRADMEVNLFGLVKALQHYLPNLKEGGAAGSPASVVAFSTVAVGQGMPFHASVAAAKAAVEGLGRSLAAELAPSIRVNIIAPSLTETPLAARLLRNDKQKEAAAARHPLKRFGRAEEVAATAGFLLSDDASWISGQVLGVDGGMSTLRTS